MEKMKRATNALIMILASVLFSKDAIAEETIVRMRASGHDVDIHCQAGPGCAGLNHTMPSIINEAWVDPDHPLNLQQLKENNTFIVYTKGDIDKRLADLDASIKALRETINQDRKVLDDTTRSVLLQIDKLPAELPTNPAFYQQLRERLKADIAADLERAKQNLGNSP
jgi:hypothetical protein